METRVNCTRKVMLMIQVVTEALLNVVGKLFCKYRLVESERALHESKADFRLKRSCIDNVFTLN